MQTFVCFSYCNYCIWFLCLKGNSYSSFLRESQALWARLECLEYQFLDQLGLRYTFLGLFKVEGENTYCFYVSDDDSSELEVQFGKIPQV